jgi:hypothetical protein
MSDRVSRRTFLQVAGSGAVAAGLHSPLGSAEVLAQAAKPGPADWSMEATIIESCTCTMFCPCYFSTVPTGHGHGTMAEHYCFNMGYRVNRGSFRGVSLDGVKVWVAGDLGADFSKGAEWAEVTFEPSATKAQRDALTTILPHVYPVTWKAFTFGKDAPIEWSFTNERAVARLAGGKAAEVVLIHAPTAMSKDPVVLRNLKYFGAPRNTGFILMPNEVNAYRVGATPFESKGTNGFMITYDISSRDVKTA